MCGSVDVALSPSFQKMCIHTNHTESFYGYLNSKDEFNGQTLKTLAVCTTRQFHCKVCGKEAGTLKLLDEHVEAFHKRIPCDLCEYTSFGKKDLRRHQQGHT